MSITVSPALLATGNNGAAQAAAATRQLRAAQNDLADANLNLKRAGGIGWDSPASNLFRNWLAALAADLATPHNAIDNAARQTAQL